MLYPYIILFTCCCYGVNHCIVLLSVEYKQVWLTLLGTQQSIVWYKPSLVLYSHYSDIMDHASAEPKQHDELSEASEVLQEGIRKLVEIAKIV